MEEGVGSALMFHEKFMRGPDFQIAFFESWDYLELAIFPLSSDIVNNL
jgi:hypothetical protein